MMELINLTLRLEPSTSKKNFYFSFYVPETVKGIQINCSYATKILTNEETTNAIVEEGFARYVLPEDAQKLAYMKIECRPLVNLVTLSLDSPAGYAGAAHRHAPEQEHYLSAEKAAPGFRPECFVPGMWRACVSTHAVVTEECIVNLKVEGVEV